ncbi:MAG: hypothetical protein RL675_210 [Bacteroidota bacterium]|jgi:hypothetical protein
MPSIKSLLKSKTVLFAVAVAVLSVLQGFVFMLPIGPHWQALVGCVIAVSVVLLRAVTNQPLSNK